MESLLFWDVYEISSDEVLHGVKLRGRVRKIALEKKINLLIDNAVDKENVVRFALLADTKPDDLISEVKKLVPDVMITLVIKHIANPTLSKLKVNTDERYVLN